MPYLYETKVSGRTCIIVHAGYIRRLDTPELKAMYSSREEFYMNARGDGFTNGGIMHGMVVAGILLRPKRKNLHIMMDGYFEGMTKNGTFVL